MRGTPGPSHGSYFSCRSWTRSGPGVTDVFRRRRVSEDETETPGNEANAYAKGRRMSLRPPNEVSTDESCPTGGRSDRYHEKDSLVRGGPLGDRDKPRTD